MKATRALVVPMAVLTAAGATASEKKIDLKDLPPAVQAAVQVHARDATGYSLSVEEEDGKATYEIETKTNGLSRDVHLDAAGVVLEVEEEIDPAHLPEAVRRAIDGAAGGRSIRKVEAITKDGATEYEVAVKGGGGKFVVSSDGTVRKE